MNPVSQRAAWSVLGALFFFACAQSKTSVDPYEEGDAGSTSTSMAGTGGGSGGGSAGTFTAISGSTGVAGSSGGTPGTAGTAGSGGTAGTLADAGAGGDCAGGAGSCADQCPDDPDKTEPGVCGCGVPDVDTAEVAGCQGLKDALVHRYTFDGTGTMITDQIGSAHGTVMNTTLAGNGLLTLATDDYGELPDGILTGLVDATFEVWVNWTANNGTMWQRIFDFGVSDMGDGMQGTSGDKYLFLAVDTFRLCYRSSIDTAEVFVDAPVDFPSPATAHVVAVFDDSNNQMRLYLNGALQGSVAVTGSLSAISDVSNWIGRSQFAADPEFGGSVREFRIYDSALTLPQIQRSSQLGEAPEFLQQ